MGTTIQSYSLHGTCDVSRSSGVSCSVAVGGSYTLLPHPCPTESARAVQGGLPQSPRTKGKISQRSYSILLSSSVNFELIWTEKTRLGGRRCRSASRRRFAVLRQKMKKAVVVVAAERQKNHRNTMATADKPEERRGEGKQILLVSDGPASLCTCGPVSSSIDQ